MDRIGAGTLTTVGKGSSTSSILTFPMAKSEYDCLRGVSRGFLNNARSSRSSEPTKPCFIFSKWEAALPFAVVPHEALICSSHRYHNKDIQFLQAVIRN